jgi:exo-1,4-beta-D-glucosaminidase
LVDAGKDWSFKDETGIPSQPPYNTLSKIIPDLVPDANLPYPLNNTWGYHDACTGNGHYETYYKAMADRFGAPVSIRDFSEKMQLVNAGGYRGIFEAAEHKIRETGGVMLWKLNAAFHSVIWQVYDWYLEPNAGYYFMQRACEPVHIQLNLDDSSVALVNRTYIKRSGLQYEVEVVSMTGASLYKQQGQAAVDTADAKEVLSIRDILSQARGISFVLLKLKDREGKTLSQNVYWMSPGHDFTGLRQMPASKVQVKVLATEKKDGYTGWTLEFTNVSSQLAFFLNPQVIRDGEEVMPSYWSDNYFSIPAGKSITIKVSCPVEELRGAIPQLRLEGWNIATATQRLIP